MSKLEPFIPPILPPEIDYLELITDIGDAREELGNLSGSLIHPVINPQLLITPLLTKEAVVSSSIEGTIATIEDVFRYEVEVSSLEDEEIRRDAQEIVNYRKALEESLSQLEKRAIGENLLKQAHYILLDSVRGSRKDRGNFRREIVYIGKPGAKIEDASFIPAPPEEIPELMKNWESYINSKKEKDPLIQIAIAHYQFEAIHPFLDGNGRIGRLVIPLFLCDRNMLPYPILYISEFFDEQRDQYIDALRSVDENSDWSRWLRFFLTGLRIQALRTQKSVLEIVDLYNSLKEKVISLGSVYGSSMLDLIFIRPAVNYPILKEHLGASPQTIYNLLNKFEEEEILFQVSDRKRNRIYIFKALIQLLR
ncbi:MAG: Fic family protein [Chloroflexi bacterium]|nr:Fic family protein [Chloroflexota bacterium]